MHFLTLRYAIWSSLLLFGALVMVGSCQFMATPASRIPIEALVRMPPSETELSADDPILVVGHAMFLYASLPLWPTRLPPRAILTEAWQGHRLLALNWTVSEGSQRESVLQLRLEHQTQPLPDLPAVSVRGVSGRAGQLRAANCGDAFAFIDCGTVSGVWWIERDVSMALTSRSLSVADLMATAETLAPLVPGGPVPFQRRIAYRGGFSEAGAGRVEQFAVPSVAYLTNLEVYVVRTAAGFVAFHGRDWLRFNRPIVFDGSRGRFSDSGQDSLFSLLGTCYAGMCWRDLDRYATRIEGGRVLVDVGVRYRAPERTYDPTASVPAWAQAWP